MFCRNRPEQSVFARQRSQLSLPRGRGGEQHIFLCIGPGRRKAVDRRGRAELALLEFYPGEIELKFPISALSLSFIAFLCIFGATLLGVYLRQVLPTHHLSSDTKETVRLSMGVIGNGRACAQSPDCVGKKFV